MTGPEVRLPADKSIAHRAMILAAMAQGVSRIDGLSEAGDVGSTMRAVRALGADAGALSAGSCTLRSNGIGGWRSPATVIDCANSGTTARLLTGAAAAAPIEAVVDGDVSLRRRPMRRVTEPLRQAGARITELGEQDRLPHRVQQAVLREIRHHSSVASAQVKSALLLAAVGAGVPAEITEPGESRDHTERMLRAMGLDVVSGAVGSEWRVTLQPGVLQPLELTIPGDFSAAAFLLGFGILREAGGQVTLPGVGVNPTRTGFIDVVRAMGCTVTMQDATEQAGEPCATLSARATPLRGTTVGPADVPRLVDEVPILAIMAACAEGETIFQGMSELRVKESDRIAALVENLRTVGVDAEEQADGFVVAGTDRPLHGVVQSRGDHRIAMAFAVLAALDRNRIEIDDMSVCAVSYPDFPTALASLAESGA